MFRWIIASSIELRTLVIAAAAAIVALGALQLRDMPVDVFPEFEKPIVEVQTEALGLSAEEVKSLITLNLEELLSGVPWLESVESESVIGMSSIKLTFQRGTDVLRARQMVQERLTLAYALPNVSSTPTLLQPLSSTSRFMMIGLTSEEIEPTALSLLARWTIQPKLVGLPGVANVAIWGQRLRELQVWVDPQRLQDSKLIQDDVVSAVGNSLWITPLSFLRGSSPGTGGFIDNPNQRLGVHHKMPIVEPEDMAQIAVSPQHLLLTGKQMAVGDVAEVTYSHPLLIGDALVNGRSGLMLVVEKFPSANTLETTELVKQAVAELKRGLPGVELDATVFQLSTYIDASVSNLTTAIIIGSVLVILVIAAFLYNWRSALISVLTIPVSLLAAVLVLGLMGATLNTMLIAGLFLALVVIIDDSIVDADKLMAQLRRRGSDPRPLPAMIIETVAESRRISMYAAAAVLLAVTPIFFMGGGAGAFFEPLAAAYAFAVLAAIVVAMTLTPALCYVFFGRHAESFDETPVGLALRDRYEPISRRALDRPQFAIVGAALLILAGVVVAPLLNQSLLPQLKENHVVVDWATPPGTSYDETFRITSRVSRELSSLTGVKDVNAHIGRAITGDQVVGINSGQIWVALDDDADFDAVLARVRAVVNGYPGVDRNVHAYLRSTVGEVLTGESTPVVVRVFGQDRAVMNDVAEDIRGALSDVAGLADLRVIGQVEEPQIRVAVDLDKAAQANVNPGEARRSAATVFSGLNVGFLFEDQKIFDVRVWSPPEARHSLTNLEEILVEKSDRHRIPLKEIADVSIEPTPTVIRHFGVAPYVDVVADVVGRDLGAVHRDVEERLGTINFPLEYRAEVLGEIVESRDAQIRLAGVVIASLIGIFLLLQACFDSWRLATIAFISMPAAAAGGVLAILISGGDASLGSIIGFFAVIGVAVRHSIMLVREFQQLEGGGLAFGPDLVAQGARTRIEPILTSVAATIAVTLPILLFGRIAGLEIVHPMAVVVLGGVIASTVMTLFFVPALYLSWGAGAQRQPKLGLSYA